MRGFGGFLGFCRGRIDWECDEEKLEVVILFGNTVCWAPEELLREDYGLSGYVGTLLPHSN